MYNNISIPNKIQNILCQNLEWQAKTQAAINKISNYLNNSEMYFFSEYTNHGIKHIQHIFYIVENLIPQASLNKLSSKDISFLILSVYLHDLGMFLKPEGLKELFSQEMWKNKFETFIKTASRMSDIELKKIYGDTQLFIRPISLDDHLGLTERDKLTYGEFIRQNHAEIAEYIALYGFPGHTNVDLLEGFEKEHRKIIGLIVKSHCMSLRSAAEESDCKLIGKRNTYMPSNIPIIYLMVLLRMGDILDMGKDRSPHILYDMQTFNSSVSKEEWEWNQTIDSSDFNWGIAKTLYIQSEPKNTMQFIKVEKI